MNPERGQPVILDEHGRSRGCSDAAGERDHHRLSYHEIAATITYRRFFGYSAQTSSKPDTPSKPAISKL